MQALSTMQTLWCLYLRAVFNLDVHNIILLVITVWSCLFLAGRFLKSCWKRKSPWECRTAIILPATENNALQLSVYLLFFTQMNANKLPYCPPPHQPPPPPFHSISVVKKTIFFLVCNSKVVAFGEAMSICNIDQSWTGLAAYNRLTIHFNPDFNCIVRWNFLSTPCKSWCSCTKIKGRSEGKLQLTEEIQEG